MAQHMILQRTGRFIAVVAAALAGLLLAACGGGGGGGGAGTPPVPTPSVTLTANPTLVGSGQSTTLTWSSTAATSCSASGGWSGAKGTSGSEMVGPLTADTTFTLACAGVGGSSGTQSVVVTIAPPAAVTLSATPSATVVNHSTTLTWSSTNATACTASGDWSGSKAASGAESTDPLTADSSFTLTCDGPGGASAPQTVTVTVAAPPAGMVVINGEVTFDRVPFRAAPATGLNPNAPVPAPARQVVVEGIEGNTVLATATTDLNGRYALIVPVNRTLFIRARAQMLKTGAAPTWDFRVRNNTNSDALYVLDGTAASSGTANSARDLHASSGWGTSSYTGERAAAPFAVLDTVFRAKELILSADADVAFPALNVFWSEDNRSADSFCPDMGLVGTSYVTFGSPPNDVDLCPTPQPGVDGIYLVGDFNAGDTDEFDQHVIAHEFGHYVEDRFSRSDSIGGNHGGDDRLDLRVAFGEGWGNAYAGMVLGDPLYRDSFDGVSDDFNIDLETDNPTAQGWFSEASVGEVLWDVFDGGSEPGDGVALGFAPIFAVMTGAQVSTDAFTSVFPFITALRSGNASASAAIGTLLNGEAISGTDAFGAGESNDADEPGVLPVYRDITRAAPVSGLCSRVAFGAADTNKLGNRAFLRFVNDATRVVTIQASGAAPNAQSVAATDPDIFVSLRGQLVAIGDSAAPNVETISQLSLPAGTYVIEVLDFDLDPGSPAPRCMTLSITG